MTDVKDIIIIGGALLGASYLVGKKMEDFLGFGDEAETAKDAAGGFWDWLTGGREEEAAGTMPDTTQNMIETILNRWKSDLEKAEQLSKAPIVVTDYDLMGLEQMTEYERLRKQFEETGELPFELGEISVTPIFDTSSWEMVPAWYHLGAPYITPEEGGRSFHLTTFLAGGYEDIGYSPTEQQYTEWYG